MRKHILLLATLASGFLISCNNNQNASSTNENESTELNVYTHRHYESDQDLFKRFEEQSGIKVNVINASADELIQKMIMEGKDSPADVLITVDAGRLVRAKSNDLLQSIESETLNTEIPEHLRDTDKQWFGLTKRARVIVYAKDKVTKEELSTYADLASDKWKNRLLIRSSDNIYNQSLLASIIANDGKDKAKDWAAGIVANMARTPRGNDTDQVRAVAAGEGDLTVVNSYYLGRMTQSSSAEDVAASEKVGIFFPNQETAGTHVNVSGAGVAKYAPNKENAVKFIEFLISEEAQKIFAHANFEYPINKKVQPAEVLQSWGAFKEDALPLHLLGDNNKDAVIIFDQVGWR